MIKHLLTKIPSNIAWMCLGMLIPALFAFNSRRESQSIAIMLKKQNVIIVGVDNPISLSMSGAKEGQISVTGEGLTITKAKDIGKYTVTAKNVSKGSILVSSGDYTEKFDCRILPFPPPIPLLGAQHNSKTIGNSEFKAQSGISAVMSTGEYGCGSCETMEYKVIYAPTKGDPIERINKGARFTTEVQALINLAKPGDKYYFDGIQARCPGDGIGRDIGSLVFKIQ
jgi:GldM C-terminal domain